MLRLGMCEWTAQQVYDMTVALIRGTSLGDLDDIMPEVWQAVVNSPEARRYRLRARINIPPLNPARN